MDVFSLTFIFIFLPITLFAYYIAPLKFKSAVLFFASIFFCLTNSVIFTTIMLINISIDFFISHRIFFAENKRQQKLFTLFIAFKNIGTVLYYLFINGFSPSLSFLGATVYSFTSLGYVLDVYSGEIPVITRYFDYGVFCCFFGKIRVGPIVTAQEFFPQLRSKQLSLSNIGEGFTLFAHGLGKKIILADNLSIIIKQISALNIDKQSVVHIWLFILCSILNVYFILSGYSDMARGIGLIFSIKLPENFRYPLQAYSISDFFAKFNISANHFVRKYVYQALDAHDNGKIATSVNIMLISITMGLWYGVSINFLLWGAFLGIFIIIENLYDNNISKYIPLLLRKVLTLLIIIMSFVLFSADTPQKSLYFFKIMIGLSEQIFINSNAMYMLISNAALIIMSIIFATDYLAILVKRFELKYIKTGKFISLIVNTLIFILSMVFIIG